MLTAHELIGFMTPELAAEILEHAHSSEKELYKATLTAVAQARKVRRVFLERLPRIEQHNTMISTLTRPSMELAAAGLLRGWLLKKHTALLPIFWMRSACRTKTEWWTICRRRWTTPNSARPWIPCWQSIRPRW